MSYQADDEDDDDTDQHDGDALLISGRHRSHLWRRSHRLSVSGCSDDNTHQKNVEHRQNDQWQESKDSLVNVRVANTISGWVAELRVYLLPLTAHLNTQILRHFDYVKSYQTSSLKAHNMLACIRTGHLRLHIFQETLVDKRLRGYLHWSETKVRSRERR